MIMLHVYEKTSSVAHKSNTQQSVSTWFPKAHLHTNSCWGFEIRPQCSDSAGKVSNFFFLDNRITWECKVRAGSFYG